MLSAVNAYQNNTRLATGDSAIRLTLDNADGLAVLAIAAEIDGLGPKLEDKPDFRFFRKATLRRNFTAE
jgi:hypothetical protein